MSKTDPKSEILIFLSTQFSKNCKIKFKILDWDIYQRNGKFLKKPISFKNQRKILIAHVPTEKVFDP